MGTRNTRIEKIEYVRSLLLKSKEGRRGIPLKVIISGLMIHHYCTKKVAEEIVQAFVDGGEAERVIGDKEVLIYG
jgi:hypothetical protein